MKIMEACVAMRGVSQAREHPRGRGKASPDRWRMAGVVALCLLAIAPNAYANQPPGPVLLLTEIMILPAMIILSLAGGAYAILDRKTTKRRRVGSWVRGLLAVFAILISGTHEAVGALVALIFGGIALRRAAQMLSWGLRARRVGTAETAGEKPRPWPVRPIVAGAMLVAVTLFLMGQAVAFLGYWPKSLETRRIQELHRFVAHQIAYADQAESRTGLRQYSRIDEKEFAGYALPKGSFRVDYGPAERSFVAYLLPTEFPFFPYNYLTSQPSYRADQSGQIRMVQVHWQDTLCPPDAPVVITVGQADIRAAREQLESLEAAKTAPRDARPQKPKTR